MIDWTKLSEKLDGARRDGRGIVLATHVNADGDGLGSEIALWHFLRSRGNTATMINDDPVPQKYRFLRGSDQIMTFDPGSAARLVREAGLFIVLDNSSPERVGRMLPELKQGGAFTICIDHHAMVSPFWNLNCVDDQASASGQIVYEAIRAMGGAITPEIAEAIYVSLVTDTGHFRFPRSTAHVHRMVADLMEKGDFSAPKIYRALYEDIHPGMNRLIAYALGDAHYEYGGRFAWARLTRAQLEACGGLEEDTGDLVNMLLAVDGVVAAALFKELPEGKTKVSLRSRGDVDVNALATRFGGGGHKNAAGVTMVVPFDDGVRLLVEGMRDVLPAAEHHAGVRAVRP
jgi:phosphoesterase RecJ-like protein